MNIILPIRIRFGASEETDIEGSAAALRQLATLFRSERPLSIQLINSTGNPFPYSAFASTIEVEPSSDKVRLLRRGDALVVVGTRKSREVLASNVDDFAKADQLGGHIHIEYYSGHPYLAMDSIPVVISAERRR